jgi:hypothetical protein
MTKEGIDIIPDGFTFSEDKRSIIYEGMDVDLHHLFVRMKLAKPEDMFTMSLGNENFALHAELREETKYMIRVIWNEDV